MNLLIFAKENLKDLEVISRLPKEVTSTIVYDLDDLSKNALHADAFFICSYSNNKEALLKVLEINPEIKWVHTWWTGVDTLIFPGIDKYKFTLTNSRGLYAKPLAEFAIFSCLFFAKNFPLLLENKNKKNWQQFENELVEGKTIGIHGYGEVGKAIAFKAKALGMKVVASRKRIAKSQSDDFIDKIVSIEESDILFKEADFLVSAAPLTPETKGFINYEKLSIMKKSAVFINVGRGKVVNEAELILALKNKIIRGAALDVFEKEPLLEESALWELENVIISPHSTDQNKGWLEGPVEFFIENCKRFIYNKPLQCVVDLKLGY